MPLASLKLRLSKLNYLSNLTLNFKITIKIPKSANPRSAHQANCSNEHIHVRKNKVFCTERSLHALINSISPAEVLAPTTGQQSWRRFVAEWVRTISTIQEQPQGQYKRGPEKEEKSHQTGQKSECFWVSTALSTWLVFPFYLLGFECKLYMINVIVKNQLTDMRKYLKNQTEN